MALKAGRVGVAPDQVDEFGKINSEATEGYTKQEADAKFETQSHASSTYETKTATALLQPKTLALPIQMLEGSQLVTKSTVEDVIQTMNNAMTNETLTDMVKRTKLLGTDDLDNVFVYGDYYWENAYPAHSPENQTFGSMRVYPCGEIIYQEIIRGAGSGASIYIRRYQNSWGSWSKFTGTAL